MIQADQVDALIGHQPGGVCPFGIPEGVQVWLDDSIKALPTTHVACGSYRMSWNSRRRTIGNCVFGVGLVGSDEGGPIAPITTITLKNKIGMDSTWRAMPFYVFATINHRHLSSLRRRRGRR